MLGGVSCCTDPTYKQTLLQMFYSPSVNAQIPSFTFSLPPLGPYFDSTLVEKTAVGKCYFFRPLLSSFHCLATHDLETLSDKTKKARAGIKGVSKLRSCNAKN